MTLMNYDVDQAAHILPNLNEPDPITRLASAMGLIDHFQEIASRRGFILMIDEGPPGHPLSVSLTCHATNFTLIRSRKGDAIDLRVQPQDDEVANYSLHYCVDTDNWQLDGLDGLKAVATRIADCHAHQPPLPPQARG